MLFRSTGVLLCTIVINISNDLVHSIRGSLLLSEFEPPCAPKFQRLSAMSKLHTDLDGVTKLTTTFSLAKLQEVPAWNARAVGRAPHSAGVKSAANSTRLASDRTIDRAEPCFITNASAYTHQQAHWINAIRGDEHVDATVSVVRLYPVTDPLPLSPSFLQESFLRSQGIVDHVFSLHDACNLANSEFCLVALHFLSYLLFLQSIRRFTSRWTNMRCSL